MAQNQVTSNPKVSLIYKNVDMQTRLNALSFIAYLFVFCLLVFGFTISNPILALIVITISVYLAIQIFKNFKKLKSHFHQKYLYRNQLLYFLQANNLYQESYDEYEVKDNQGNIKTQKVKVIVSSAVLSWLETENDLIIYGYKVGNNFDKRLEELDRELSALFNLELEEKIIRPALVEYHFYIQKPERLILRSSSVREQIENLDTNLGYGVIYNPARCPHILVAGGTGSGKSVFISFLILELLKRSSTIYIADPKNSDLGSLSHYLGDERVATSPNNIARVVRLAVTEMQERYSYMKKNFIYGSNFETHNFKPIWFIFDEMGAFQASGTDKNSKAVVSEVMDGIKQIILLGRQAGVFVLIAAQQMNADTLNTDLRDNLGLRIALGTNSSEGYRMVFGSANPESRPIETKGAGFLYMQGSGEEIAKYWESPFLDTNQFDFIQELQLYI